MGPRERGKMVKTHFTWNSNLRTLSILCANWNFNFNSQNAQRSPTKTIQKYNGLGFRLNLKHWHRHFANTSKFLARIVEDAADADAERLASVFDAVNLHQHVASPSRQWHVGGTFDLVATFCHCQIDDVAVDADVDLGVTWVCVHDLTWHQNDLKVD